MRTASATAPQQRQAERVAGAQYVAIIEPTAPPSRAGHLSVVVYRMTEVPARPVAIYDIGNIGRWSPGMRSAAAHRLRLEGWQPPDDRGEWRIRTAHFGSEHLHAPVQPVNRWALVMGERILDPENRDLHPHSFYEPAGPGSDVVWRLTAYARQLMGLGGFLDGDRP